MSSTPPMTPPGVPPQEPVWQPTRPYPPPREGSNVSFYVAITLGILLLVSGAVNVLLLLVSIGGLASGGLGGMSGDDSFLYEVVRVGGDANASDKVLRIPIQGAIAEAQSPLLGASGGMVSDVRRALRLAADDQQVRGILLSIDSPGGGVTDSDEIYRLLRAFQQRRPEVKVVALFGDLAASGGYYVAAAAERIFARRTSITGSIGVIMSAWNFAAAAEQLGIQQIAIKSERTPYKDILSPTRSMTDDERRLLTDIVEELYERFVEVVDQGRPQLDADQVRALANGAIYSANQALQNGLVDEIGDPEVVERWFRDALGPTQIIEYKRRPGLRELLFGVRAPTPPTLAQTAERLLAAGTGPRFLYFWQGGR